MNPGRPLPPVAEDQIPEEFALLRACLAVVPDHRQAKGRLYALPAVLSLVVLGLMADCRSLSAIMRFGRCHAELLPLLGLRWVPSVPTLSRVLAGVDAAALRAALLHFSQELARRRQLSHAVVAMDGKTVRGVQEGAEPLHLLHLFGHHSALVLDQLPVHRVRGEVTGAKVWIAEMARQFPGLAVLTADALYADRDLCAAIVAQEYAYLIKLKKTSSASTPTRPISSRPPRTHR
jgi:hypothetical protein